MNFGFWLMPNWQDLPQMLQGARTCPNLGVRIRVKTDLLMD